MVKRWTAHLEQMKRGDDPIHVTEEGLARLREKLSRLKQSLPELIAEAERTAAYGDRSDNAEYKEAKGTLRRTHRQIWSIEDQLKRVMVIKSGPNATHTIEIGSAVVLETEGIETTFQIVGSHETDPGKGRISFHSPLGMALMHRKKGEAVTIETKGGFRTYRILEVK